MTKPKQRFQFKSRESARAQIANAAGHGQTKLKNKLVAVAHKEWPPKKR